MFKTISWTVHIRTKTKEFAQVIFQKFEQEMGVNEVISFKESYKDTHHTLFIVECKSPFGIEEPEKAILNLLLLVGKFGRELDLNLPIHWGENEYTFHGSCKYTSIDGLAWFEFHTDNFGLYEQGE